MKYLKILFIVAVLICYHNFAISDEETSYTKKIKYEVSLNYTLWNGTEWWSKIEPYNLYLGGLPLKNQGHLEAIKALGVTRVLSLVEDFELRDGWWHQPVKQAEWNGKGIEAKQISAVDFLPLSPDQIQESVEYLNKMLLQGHTVYVHCKAGVGRSASAVIAYLMQYQNLFFEEAFAYVQGMRPQIHLNEDQRQAVMNYLQPESIEIDDEIELEEEQDYFKQAQALSEETLKQALNDMLHYVIEGVEYASDQYTLPDFMKGWVPGIKIESTLSRRNRYLLEYNGNQNDAVTASVAKNHGLQRKWTSYVAGLIPFIGAPANYTLILWHQMREVALIASIYGHDLHDEKVKIQILGALVEGDLMKIPAQTTDIVVKKVFKKLLMQAGLKNIPGISIPAHVVFNYFTDNSAKVSTYAIETFGGEHARPVPKLGE